ncbi:MAG: peptidylprolyl isomerase [Acetobacteraceae bacterium]|nr:peptidylprolyl isomerase [Acetobacteraceae bacterium]
MLARLALAALLLSPLPTLAQGPAGPRAGAVPAEAQPNANRILAVVNGDVVTQAEVASRARLFALNAGVAVNAETLARLQPQVLRLLVDERLRMQEVQRLRIPVSDNDVADAIAEIERRNNLPAGGLRAQLRNAGVQPRTLFDQVRAQIGWGRLLRALLGPRAEVSDQEVQDTIAAYRARQGQPEFLVGEIYIPIDNAAQDAEVRRFVEEVVAQLRRGTPFPVAATQFSQSQSAVAGGDLGWVGLTQLDPEVAAVVERMPPGAVSNPIRVAGGYQIVTLRARREVGREAMSTMLSIRQVFLPFDRQLDPQNPTDQQRQTLERAQRLSQTLRGCEAMDQQPRAGDRPTDPGPIRLEGLNPPALRSLLGGLPIGRPSQPIVAPDGIMLIMVCNREQRNQADFNPDVARNQILRDRVEVISRQLQRELRRRAVIETRG